MELLETENERSSVCSSHIEEIRWNNFQKTMVYLPLLFPSGILKLYWFGCLNSLKVFGYIPETPIHESICFLEYVLQDHQNDNLLASMIEYEQMRNRSLLYDFSQHGDTEVRNINDIQSSFLSYRAVINPSFVMKKFNLSISCVISMLNQHGSLMAGKDYLNNKDEVICFYKHRKSGIAVTANFSEMGGLFLSELISSENLSAGIEFVCGSLNLDHATCIRFIKILIQNDMITVVKN